MPAATVRNTVQSWPKWKLTHLVTCVPLVHDGPGHVSILPEGPITGLSFPATAITLALATMPQGRAMFVAFQLVVEKPSYEGQQSAIAVNQETRCAEGC